MVELERLLAESDDCSAQLGEPPAAELVGNLKPFTPWPLPLRSPTRGMPSSTRRFVWLLSSVSSHTHGTVLTVAARYSHESADQPERYNLLRLLPSSVRTKRAHPAIKLGSSRSIDLALLGTITTKNCSLVEAWASHSSFGDEGLQFHRMLAGFHPWSRGERQTPVEQVCSRRRIQDLRMAAQTRS